MQPRELLFSLNDIQQSRRLPIASLLSISYCFAAFPMTWILGNRIFCFCCQNNFWWFILLLLYLSLYVDFLLSFFFFNKSVFRWQKMPCMEIQVRRHYFSLVELKHSKSLSKLQLKWYVRTVLNQMFAFHLHFGFYSKSSEIYFRVLKMSFNSWQDLSSFSHSRCLEEFFPTDWHLLSCILKLVSPPLFMHVQSLATKGTFTLQYDLGPGTLVQWRHSGW